MGLSAGAHHRRRSSMLTGTGRASQPISTERRDDTLWSHGDGGNHKREEQEPLTAEDDTDASDVLSAAETLELDPMSSDDDQYDEETGLTSHQKRQRRRRRKQRRKLDARIADVKGQGSIREILSDRNVVKKLLINGGLILLWYFFSLSISIYNKWMFSENDIVFPFPLFTTSLHMAVQFTLSVIILWIFPSLRPRQPTGSAATSPIEGPEDPQPLMTKLFYFTRLVPCGAATSLDVGLGNMSLRFISLTFLTMCKSSALAFVLLFAFLFRLETPSTKLIIIIATMTIGVVMMVAGETAFNALGFALVIASAFFSGFRWGLTQILLLRHPATSNPFSTLFLLTPIMFLSLITIALSIEGPHDIYQGYLALASKHGNLFGSFLLIFPGVLAFCMISSEFALLKRSSVVTLSICGIFKEVVTISAAGIIFHDKLTTVNVTGLVVTISSIAAYNYMKISGMRSELPEDDSSSRESSPASDTDEGEHSSGDPGDYRRVAHQDSSIISPAPGGHLYDDAQSSSAGDKRRSFRVRSSGARRGLSISTSIILEDDGQPSPLRSAPATITTMAEAGFPHLHVPDREASPGVQSSSSVSPIRSQNVTQH